VNPRELFKLDRDQNSHYTAIETFSFGNLRFLNYELMFFDNLGQIYPTTIRLYLGHL
jgi:hypothetical protein